MTSVINKCFKHTSPAKLGKSIADICWYISDGIAQINVLQYARSYLHMHVYTPANILKAMDMAGGVCNLVAYKILYSVEHLSRDPLLDNRKNCYVLPHEWKIREASKKMNLYADSILPM